MRDGLLSTFGMSEYEDLAYSIICFLKSDKKSVRAPLGFGADEATRWERQFAIDDVTSDPEMFAMFAAAGWLRNSYFPKRVFTVSDGFIDRLREEEQAISKREPDFFKDLPLPIKPSKPSKQP